MPLSDAEKASMVRQTHEMALALADDLNHMRDVVANPRPSSGDIRRLSNELRRILIDNNGDIRKVAPCRIGRLMLAAPDTKQVEKICSKAEVLFCSAGAFRVFDFTMHGMVYNKVPVDLSPVPPPSRILLRLDGFLSQRVLCFKGSWASRADVIKYVANVAHGVHSGDPKEPAHALLGRVRHSVCLKRTGGTMELGFDHSALANGADSFVMDRDALDIVLLQLAGAAQLLTSSPDVLALEEMIRHERVS